MTTIAPCEEGKHAYQIDDRKAGWAVSEQSVTFGYTCIKCGNKTKITKKMGELSSDEVEKAQQDGLAITL